MISSAAARSNQCRVEMKLRDDARGLHAQGEAHELPHGKRLLGMRRLTPVGIPFLQASHFYRRPRIWSRRGRFGTFWHQLKACTDKSPLPTALLPEPRESIGLRSGVNIFAAVKTAV